MKGRSRGGRGRSAAPHDASLILSSPWHVEIWTLFLYSVLVLLGSRKLTLSGVSCEPLVSASHWFGVCLARGIQENRFSGRRLHGSAFVISALLRLWCAAAARAMAALICSCRQALRSRRSLLRLAEVPQSRPAIMTSHKDCSQKALEVVVLTRLQQ